MHLPAWLYHETHNTTNSYTTTSTGQPEVSRLVQGMPDFWIKSGATERAKKTLVLTDWTAGARKLSDKKIQTIRDIFTQLLKEGFDIYVWQDPSIKKLSQENCFKLTCRLFLDNITPIDHNDVIKKMADLHNISSSQIANINVVNFKKLMNALQAPEDIQQPLGVTVADIKGSRFPDMMILDHVMREKITIISDKYDQLQEKEKELIAINDNVKIIKQYSTMKLIVADDQDEYNDMMEYVNYLKLSIDIDENDCCELLKKSKNIKKLLVKSSTQKDISNFIMQCSEQQLAQLVSFKTGVFDEIISSKAFLKIINNSNNLKSLGMGKCILPNILPEELLDGALKNLQELSLDKKTNQAIGNILVGKAANLNKYSGPFVYSDKIGALSELVLYLDGMISFPQNLNKNFFFKLQELTLLGGSLNGDSLGTLFNNAISLRTITLRNCRGAIGELNKNALKKLESLSIDEVSLAHSDLIRLLNHAPYLKNLSLEGRKLPSTWITQLLPETLSQLENLVITDCEITAEDFITLMKRAPLIRLDLSIDNANSILSQLPENAFAHVEELSLPEKCAENPALVKLLKNTPALKICMLDRATNAPYSNLKTIEFFMAALPEKWLSQLRCFNVPWDKKIAQKILNKVPNLNKACRDTLKESIARNDDPKNNKNSPAPFVGTNQAAGATSIDFDTTPRLQRFNVTQVFWSIDGKSAPPPSNYRINILHKLDIINYSENPFYLYNSEDLQCHAVDDVVICERDTYSVASRWNIFSRWLDFFRNNEKKQKNRYYGKMEISFSHAWVSLPSLSAYEKLTHLHIAGIKKENIEIRYSKRDNVYSVRNKEPSAKNQSVMIDFLLSTPVLNNNPFLSEEIQKLVNKYKNFENRSLILPAEKTGKAYLNAIQTQQVGACRHRSVAFKEEMERYHPEIPVRIIANDCHMAVEIFEKGKWHYCCLGGAPAIININRNNAPTITLRFNVLNNINTIQQHFITLKTAVAKKFIAFLRFFRNKVIRKNISTPTPIEKPISIPTPKKPPIIAADNIPSPWSSPTTEATLENILLCVARGLSLTTHNIAKNILVQMKNDQDLAAFRLLLQKTGEKLGREVFYVDSPKDLVCSSPTIIRDNNNAGILRARGGPLETFLRKPHLHPPIIIINWSNFTASDIVKYNSIMDDPRVCDGTPVPPHTTVVGLYNTENPSAYKGADFFSRQNEKISIEKTEELQQKARPFMTLLQEGTPIENSSITIDLYQSPYWKTTLLGQWTLQGEKLHFQEGELSKALSKMKTNSLLILKNAPWENPEFVVFWQQALLHREIENQGKKIILPETLQLYRSEGYDWKSKGNCITWMTKKKKNAFVLHPGSLYQFFSHYVFQKSSVNKKNGQLYLQPGWLEKNKGKSIAIHLTRTLSAHQWGELLECAKKTNVKLHITLSKGITLPENFHPEIKVKCHVPRDQGNVFCTNDSDYALATLDRPENTKVIDISENEASDLLVSLQANINQKTLKFYFSQKTNAVWDALKNNETVILKGKFSPELVDALTSLCLPNAHLWVNGKKETIRGKLLLITENPNHFNFLPTQTITLEQTREHKITALKHFAPETYDDAIYARLPEGNLAEYSFIQLCSLLRFLKANPHALPEDNWAGLRVLKKQEKPKNESVDLSLEASEAFTQARYHKITHALSYNPFVFIAGATGVGKSTFVHKILKNTEGYTVYTGKANLTRWANNKKPGKIKVLFIDEANIEAGDFSIFEGLFETPPYILIKGEMIPLTKEHKVVFAGNPLSYGSRKLPALFSRHGGSIVFEPLSPANIVHDVLIPIMRESEIKCETQIALLKKIIQVYQAICRLSPENILISPRELQMMVLLIVAKNKKNISDNDINYAIYQVADPLIPIVHKKDFTTWYKNTIGNNEPPLFLLQETLGKFIITRSRFLSYQQITTFLSLRKYKQTTKNAAAKYAGLGAMILEGEPGTGKSHFVKDVLASKGFKEIDVTNHKPQKGDIFYWLPVSMPPAQKIKVLLKAFHEGAIVVVDEINSCPMIEDLMNDLLMGMAGGKCPKKPGFMLIGTQNPITMEGRIAASIALERRWMKSYFSDYPVDEMQTILEHYGVDKIQARSLVEKYTIARDLAIKHGKTPVPTFRDLLHRAEAIIPRQKEMATEIFIRKPPLLHTALKTKKQVSSRYFLRSYASKKLRVPKRRLG